MGAGGGEPIPVLRGVVLVVKGGELVAVVGQSGSGKSTLLCVLGLLEDADAGEIVYENVCVSALPRSAKSRARGRWVGFVFQSFLLLPSLTALENVLLAARYTGRDRAEARRRGLALLDELGVVGRKDHYPQELSAGEQQRAAFCRPWLDQPTSVTPARPSGAIRAS